MGTSKETSNNDKSAQKDESTSNCEKQKSIEQAESKSEGVGIRLKNKN